MNEAAYEEVKAPNDLNQTASHTQNENEALELLTNDIVVEKGKEHKYLWNSSSWNPTHKINFLLGLCTLSYISSFSAKASSKEEPRSVPPAAADKADSLPEPPEGAVFTDEGEGEIVKNDPSEDENFEVMDLHDEAAQTQGTNKIVTE